jgi:hypothetical protein
MPWRIDIGRILKRPRIIHRITQAWLLLLVVGSFQPTRLLMVVAPMHSAGLRAAIGSVQLGRPLVGPFQKAAGPGPVIVLHREIHWLVFGGATFLLLLGSRNHRQELRSAFAMCLLGLSLEYLQYVIYHIDAIEWPDVLDDVLAILVALALYWLAGTCKAAFRATRRATESKTLIPSEAAKS